MGRDLTLAGGVLVKEGDGSVKLRVIETNDPIGMVPLSWSEGSRYDYDIDLEENLNVWFGLNHRGGIMEYIAELLNVDKSQIVGHDIALVDKEPAGVFGDLITSPRLDNLSSSYACLKAFLASKAKNTLNVCAVFDAEEIGSRTRAGALSDMLEYTLEMICKQRKVDVNVLKANGLFLSADAAHAAHPNYPMLGCKLNTTPAGCGVILKESFKGSYGYDEKGMALVIEAGRRSGAKCKYVGFKNGRRGGGTIGPKVEANIQIATVDIGPPVWGMHSQREMMAWTDVEEEVRLLTYIYNNFEELHKWTYHC